MALALNKIIVTGTTTNNAAAYPQTTTVAGVTTGNGTVVAAGLYQMSAQANITVIQYDGTAWTTVIANNTGGVFFADGTNVAIKAVNANTTATLVTVNGGQAASQSTYATS
jgi:hypothetical protein